MKFLWARRLAWVLLVVVQTSWSAPSSSSGVNFKGSKRFGLMYGAGQIQDIEADTINDFSSTKGVVAAYEVGMLFSIFATVNYFENRGVKVTWKGVANTPVEFYGYMVERIGKSITL